VLSTVFLATAFLATPVGLRIGERGFLGRLVSIASVVRTVVSITILIVVGGIEGNDVFANYAGVDLSS
jgi:hypothetical protein